MARLLTAGAETLSAIGENKTMEGGITTVAAITVDTGTVHSGSKSFKCDTAAGAQAYIEKVITPVLGTIFYARAWINLPAYPGAAARVLDIGLDAGLAAGLELQTNGTLLLKGPAPTPASSALLLNTWYCIEVAAQNNSTASTSYREGRLNGVSFAATSTTNATTVSTGYVRFGWFTNASGLVNYIDDCAVNDSNAGTGSTSWPGLGKQVLLRPISDNAVGTGWTNDAGSATDIFNAVDNIPPIGIADTGSGTGLNQIRNASNASANYDANLTTYASAGIQPQDTINLVQPWIITGAPSATGAKTGALQITANPAEGAATAFQTTSNFFRASGTNAGTYPTGWAFSTNPITYAPSVTVASSPVLRADITGGTATRIADVCFMGLYVDYTPYPAAKSRMVNQSVQRASSY